MNNTERFLTSLSALRASLIAAADQITVVIDLASQPIEGTEAEHACPHPVSARQSRAVMGHPTRFYCGMCQQVIE